MNIGLTVSRRRMSPCLPGVDLWILSGTAEVKEKQVVETEKWHSLAWGRELMQRNVNVLLCAGISRFLWGALRGDGIQVVPDAMGVPDEVAEQWQSGGLTVPRMWPPHVQGGHQRRFGKRRHGCRGRE